METRWIKIDSAFPDSRARELQDFLALGWFILDKTVTEGRYINYLISKKEIDEDIGKTSASS